MGTGTRPGEGIPKGAPLGQLLVAAKAAGGSGPRAAGTSHACSCRSDSILPQALPMPAAALILYIFGSIHKKPPEHHSLGPLSWQHLAQTIKLIKKIDQKLTLSHQACLIPRE
jgi:hypothetical protein